MVCLFALESNARSDCIFKNTKSKSNETNERTDDIAILNLCAVIVLLSKSMQWIRCDGLPSLSRLEQDIYAAGM